LYEQENSSSLSGLEKELPCDAKVLTSTSTPEILIDVTERTHLRHQKNAWQKKHYSGKKGTHTVKNKSHC